LVGNYFNYKTIAMKNLEYAKKWLELNNVPTFIDDGSLYITIDAFDIQLSTAEVNYRAELFLESELQGVKVN
jgi:hypothetical protein